MMNIKGIFAVSLIAMVAVVAGVHTSNAVAAIASQGYVDQQVGSKLSSISGSTTGSGNVVTVVSASGSNVSANKGITAEETKNKVTSVRAVSSATDTAYPSEKAVATALADKADATALEGKVDVFQGGTKANQAVITNGAGNIITGFITKSMLGEDVVIPDEYDLPVAKTSALGGVKSGGDINVSTAGVVTVSHATTADTATNATNATNDAEGHKITETYATKNELSDGLSGKQNSLGYTAENSANKVKSVRAAASATDTAYPSEKAVATALAAKVAIAQGSAATNKAVITNSTGNVTTGQIATGMIADDAVTADKIKDGVIPTVNNATLTIKKNGESVGTFTANASADKEIDIEVPDAGDILTTTTVTSSGTGAVLTGVSVTAGKVTLQKGNVQIPSGGQNATSYVSIWVE